MGLVVIAFDYNNDLWPDIYIGNDVDTGNIFYHNNGDGTFSDRSYESGLDLEFNTKDSNINPLMGWETSTDTLGEVILKFSSKDKAIEYAEKNSISYEVFEPKKKEFVIKSYAHNFLKK